jgi:hypothetical protein
MELRFGKQIRGSVAVTVLAVVLTPGCVSTESFLATKDEPPRGAVCIVTGIWNNEVAFVPDPTHNGQMTPGLVGRVYLFGPSMDFPQAAEGDLVVDLYDETHEPMGGQTLPLEVWHIDKETLQRLLRRDRIGWGYTVFLPWGTYKPTINHIGLKTRFEPVCGTKLYDESSLSLHRTGITEQNGQALLSQPAGAKPIQAGGQ